MIVFYTSVLMQIIASLFYWLKIRRPLSHPEEDEYEWTDSTEKETTEMLDKSTSSPRTDNSRHSLKSAANRSPRNSNRFLQESPKRQQKVLPSTLLREIVSREKGISPK